MRAGRAALVGGLAVLVALLVAQIPREPPPEADPAGSRLPGYPEVAEAGRMPKARLLDLVRRRQEAEGLAVRQRFREDGPWKHVLAVLATPDGVSMAGQEHRDLLAMGSVPDAQVGADGLTRLVFVNAMPFRAELGLYEEWLPDPVTPADLEEVARKARVLGIGLPALSPGPPVNTFCVAELEGERLLQVRPVGIRGFAGDGYTTADPSLVLLPDGTWRLYFFLLPLPGGGRTHGGGVALAEGRDGRNFTWTGLALPAGVADTEVFQGATRFFALLPWGGGLRSLASPDGLAFPGRVEDGKALWARQGSSAARVARMRDGPWRMYFRSGGYARSATSPDGAQWTWDDRPGVPAGGVYSTVPAPGDRGYLHFFHY